MRRWFGTLGLVLGLGGCFDGEELTKGLTCEKHTHCGGAQLCINGICGGEQIEMGADPCEIGGNSCVDTNTLGVCNLSDQSTMEVSCDMSCEQSGFSTSLGCHTSTGSKHQCYCDQKSAMCTDPVCSNTVFLDCSGGDIQPLDCDEFCQNTGLAFYTCDPSMTPPCECVSGGCSEGATFCQDDLTEVRCVGGVWQPQPCTNQLCDQLQCEFGTCPEDYAAQTLGCGYSSTNGNMGCLCTT